MPEEYEDLGPVYEDLGLPKTRRQAAGEMFTDIPHEITSEIDKSVAAIKGFGDWAKGQPISDPYATGDQPKIYPGSGEGGQPATPGSVGRGLMAGAGALGSELYLASGAPVAVGAAKSALGHGYEAAVGGDEDTYKRFKKGMDIGGAVYGGGAALKGGARTLRDWWKGGALPTQTAAGEASMARASGIAREFDPTKPDLPGGGKGEGQLVAGSLEEGGAYMQRGLRSAAESERAEISKQFQVSTGDFGKTAKPAAINTEVAMSMPQQIVQDLQMNRVSLKNNKEAAAVMKAINTKINTLAARNRGVPSSGQVTNFNLSSVDAMKIDMNKHLRDAVKSGNQEDVQAVHKIMESFDRQVDGWVNSNKFKGDPRAVKAWNVARQRENLYRETFTSAGGRDTPGAVVERIVGENKHAPQTGQAVADYAIGSMGIHPPQYNANVITGIRDILGKNSPEWTASRQGTWMSLVTPAQSAWKPREIKTAILDFLDGKGREVANVMYSSQERAAMRDFATLQGHLDIARLPQGTPAAQVPMKVGAALAGKLVGIFKQGPDLLHTGLTVAEAAIRQAKELREFRGQIGTVRQSVAKWWDQVNPTGKNMNPREQRMKTYTATVTLASALRRFGIDNIAPGRAQAEGQPGKVDKVSFGGPSM